MIHLGVTFDSNKLACSIQMWEMAMYAYGFTDMWVNMFVSTQFHNALIALDSTDVC